MKGISKLKDDARRHEQREEWDKAIALYLEVIAAADEAGSGEAELPLYNRVGDLCLRLGQPRDAVRYYEQAADRYAEAGLYNNAIALCNKALRYLPDQLEVIRRLGQFSASQGFLTDARRYFIEYADKKTTAGDTDAALSALDQYADLSGEPEIRELLGRKLQQAGRSFEAVAELKRAYALYLGTGETEVAARLRSEILELQPSALDDEGEGGTVPVPPMPKLLPDSALELPDLPDDAGEDELEPGLAPADLAPDEPTGGEDERELDAAEIQLLAGFETTMLGPDAFGETALEPVADLESVREFDSAEAETLRLEGLDPPVPPDLQPEQLEPLIALPLTPDLPPELDRIPAAANFDMRGMTAGAGLAAPALEPTGQSAERELLPLGEAADADLPPGGEVARRGPAARWRSGRRGPAARWRSGCRGPAARWRSGRRGPAVRWRSG